MHPFVRACHIYSSLCPKKLQKNYHILSDKIVIQVYSDSLSGNFLSTYDILFVIVL